MSEKRKPNHQLRQCREKRGWSQARLAELIGSVEGVVSKWERGISVPDPFYREKLCELFEKDAYDLGFLEKQDTNSITTLSFIKDPHENTANLSLFDLGVVDKLDNVESIINLAWEAWFASRPREVARSVNRLLPGLEKIAYSPYPPIHTLRAKNLAIRAHGLLGSVCSDAQQNDTALFHYMQAHRFAEEIQDVELAATYLCLVGDVLRQQNDQIRALSHMERARDLVPNNSNATRGHILQLLAYAYGDTKQEEAFNQTISEATDLLAFSGEGVDISQKEFIPFEVYEIQGKVYRDLGQPLKAIPYLELAEKSLVTENSVTPRWHALLEISRAQAYCDAGDIVNGTKLACKGFIMAFKCHSPHQMNRVRKLLRKLESGPFRNHSGVQDLKNLLYETYMSIDNGIIWTKGD
jgi:transcriptional regulator with XRE-family HTH domain